MTRVTRSSSKRKSVPEASVDLSLVHQLPAEIFEIILYYVHDRQTLRACSLACRAWVGPVRKQLFSAVVLRGKKRFDAFHRLLKTSSWVAPLVRSLEFASLVGKELWCTLTQLPNVQGLILRNLDLDLPVGARAKISRHCAHLRSLTLYNVALYRGDLCRILYRCPQLLHFSATTPHLVKDIRESSFNILNRAPLVPLETLELFDQNAEVLHVMLDAQVDFHPSRLILHASNFSNALQITPALERASEHLRTFVLLFDGRAQRAHLEFLAGISFAPCPNLTALHIANFVAHHADMRPMAWQRDMGRLPLILACIAPASVSLTRVVLTQRFPTKMQRAAFRREPPRGWEDADGALAALARARPFELRVQLVQHGVCPQRTVRQATIVVDKLAELLRARLPLFRETGALWVVVCGHGFDSKSGEVYGGTVSGRRWERWFNPDERLFFKKGCTHRVDAARDWEVAVSGQWPEQPQK